MVDSASNCGRLDHCCWLKGKICRYLAIVSGEYQYRCSLRLRASSWEEVVKMPEYIKNVKPKLVEIGYTDIDCHQWPPPGHKCNTCGNVG